MNSISNESELKRTSPVLSVIVIAYNMHREIPRTLFSLSVHYQQDISEEDYEVIVVENGSQEPLSSYSVTRYGPNFKYLTMPNPSPSPASAINYGVNLAKGRYLGIMIDGARILSPGVLKYALIGINAFKNPFIYTLSWHLGDDIQRKAVSKGYNQEIEDRLLESVNWKNNGYRLFEISTLAANSRDGWFMPSRESNCFFLNKKMYEEMGGYDVKFDKPGGGLCNHDFFKRACERSDSDLVQILGEGTFHQIHGGISTNTDFPIKKLMKEYLDQYQNIRRIPFSISEKKPLYIGHIPDECVEWLHFSAVNLHSSFAPLKRKRLRKIPKFFGRKC